MADQRVINLIYGDQRRDRRIIDETLRISAESVRLLKDNPPPDTFIGRKTHEPFPQGESRYGEETDRGRTTEYPSEAAKQRDKRKAVRPPRPGGLVRSSWCSG
ncbi:hypothetical protein ACQPTN_35290 [Bradyrhizobium sp. 13971]